MLVARDGYGDMAVSNAIGSNVFDIDLGLGFPFLISSLIRNFEPVHILSKEEQVSFCFSLLIISLRFLLIIVLSVLSNCTRTYRLGSLEMQKIILSTVRDFGDSLIGDN